MNLNDNKKKEINEVVTMLFLFLFLVFMFVKFMYF
jgi:hypothetical protein